MTHEEIDRISRISREKLDALHAERKELYKRFFNEITSDEEKKEICRRDNEIHFEIMKILDWNYRP